MLRIIYHWFLLAALASNALLAEEPLPLPVPDTEIESESIVGFSLEELEAMALSHPAITEAAGKVRAARGEYIQAGLYPNPVVGYLGSEIGNEGRGGQQGGFLEQEFVTSHKLDLQQQAACWEIRRREQLLAEVQLGVLCAVRIRYYEAAIAERAIAVATDVRDASQQGLKLTELRKAAKEVSDVDVLQSRFELDSAKVTVAQSEAELFGARQRLEAALGGMSLADLPIAEFPMSELPNWAWEDAWTRVRTESPSLAALQLDIERARWNLRRQIAGRIPNVTIQAIVQDDHATGYTVAGAQIGMPLPFYNCNEGNIEQARGELLAATRAVGRLEAELQAKLATVFREFQSARTQAETYREQMLPDADRAFKLVKVAYGSGDMDYLRLLSAQQNYSRTHLAYLKTLQTVWTRHAVIGGLLTAED